MLKCGKGRVPERMLSVEILVAVILPQDKNFKK
jgi:hypothetical protein